MKFFKRNKAKSEQPAEVAEGEKPPEVKFSTAKEPLKRYVKTDGAGVIVGFYSSDINPVIPPEAVPIKEEDYQRIHSEGGTKYRFLKGKLIFVDTPSTRDHHARNAIHSGLTITIAGVLKKVTFSADRTTVRRLVNVMCLLTNKGKFPGSAEKYPIKDAKDGWHVLTMEQYKAVALAIISYAEGCEIVADGCTLHDDDGDPTNGAGLPASDITIKI